MSQPPAPPPGWRAAHGEELPPPTRNQVLATAAEYAVQAPSLHDIQPWQIERHPDHLAIRADRSRQPAGLDPTGRELVESAGAALFNVRVALAQGGWHAEVLRLPRADEPDVLADVRPIVGAPDGALAVLAPALSRRRTDRRRFTDARVPDDVLGRLRRIAATEGVVLIPVVVEALRRLVARVAQGADEVQSADPAYRANLPNRTTPDLGDGAPAEPVPQVEGLQQGAGQATVLLATPTDDELAWLRAGEAMQYVLLELTRLGWAASPLTQPIEVPLIRTRLRGALAWDAHPQMLLRIGSPEAVQRAAHPRGDAVLDGGP